MSVNSERAAKSGAPVRPSLTIKRRFNAPPEKIYGAWTDPEKIAIWWGPGPAEKGFLAECDLRAGGRFRVVSDAGDGQRNDVSGTYREVVANEKLVFTWAWHTTPERESLVTIVLKRDGEGTWLTLTHEQFFDETARDNHRTGWSGALDKLDKLFA